MKAGKSLLGTKIYIGGDQAMSQNDSTITRRTFLKTSAVLAAGAAVMNIPFVHAQGSDRIRVGLIGCGGRGKGAANDCVNSASGIEIYAIGDLFQDRMESAKKDLRGLGDKANLSDDRCFHGFDNYLKVIQSGVDMVILATPPGFRPQHFKAAIEAGKHVFMEKPVAVCPTGVRTVIAASELASQKKLGVVAGTQRRHDKGYQETINRLRDGAAGKIVSAQCYWNQGGLWRADRQDNWSDTEWQIRNWLYFAWLSGDHIVEQHIHNIDVINWVLGATPVKAVGMGGRQSRTEPAYGHIYDHFAIDFEYPGGVKVLSMCRQIDNCANRVGEFVMGTEGVADPGGWIKGKSEWSYSGSRPNPYIQEHTDLIASIRAGKPLNEGRQVAESTLCAIMGRMAAYTGQEITWEKALNSDLNLMKENLTFGPMAVDPVAMPGKTRV